VGGGRGNPEPAGGFADWQAADWRQRFLGHEALRAAKAFALTFHPVQAGDDALPNPVSVELGDRPEHVQLEAAGGGCRVDAL
jgi:hypothetical protein